MMIYKSNSGPSEGGVPARTSVHKDTSGRGRTADKVTVEGGHLPGTRIPLSCWAGKVTV